MIGCILATAGVIGLMRLAHFRRHGCGGRWGGHGGWGHHRHHDHGGYDGDDAGFGGGGFSGGGFGGPWGHRFGGGRFGFGRRFFMRAVLDRLEATPAQERVIVAAADEFREAAAKLRDEAKRSRGDVAGAFRKSSFDEVMLGELFARHDTEIEGVRRAFVGFGAKVHDALDEKQRARLADMIDSGPGFFRRGPFSRRGPFGGGGGFGHRGFDRGFDGDFDRHGGGW